MEPETQPAVEPQQSTTPPSPPTSQVKPIKETTKLPIILVTVIAVLSLAISGYLGYQNYLLKQQIAQFPTTSSSPTADPTADWKLFTNTAYKYSLRYPANWTVSAKANIDPTTNNEPVFDSSCDYDTGELCQQFYVDATESTNTTDLEPSFIIKDDDVVIEKQNIKINGHNAVSFLHYSTNYTDLPGTLNYVVVTNYNGYKYTIFYRESQKDKEFKNKSDLSDKQIFDQILSTINFLDEAVTKVKVEGKICYPSNYVPPGNILAKSVKTGEIEKTSFEGIPPNKQEYSLMLTPGKYVFAYDPGGKGSYMGFYTPCALGNCSTPDSHQLTEVDVVTDNVINNIDLCDYYYQQEEKPDF